MKRAITLLAGTGLALAASAPAWGNTVSSSTMVFQGFLSEAAGDGSRTGVVAMANEETATGLLPGDGDGAAGFDVYARQGATAWFGDDPGSGPVWTSQAIGEEHDAWPSWPTDTPDWYQYSVEFYDEGGQHLWALRNHPAATADHPWDDTEWWGEPGKLPRGVPMSGTMDWDAMIATETGTGAYLPGTGTAEIPGGAAAHGGGPGCWDMDWSWGSEAVPLQFSKFKVNIHSSAQETITFTPIPEPITMFGVFLGLGGLTGYIRKRRT